MKFKIMKYFAVVAILAVCIVAGGMLDNQNKEASRSLFAMDTYMEITAYGRNSQKAVDAAAAEIERLDALLSTGSQTSEVTVLNNEKTGKPSEDMAYLLERSQEINRETEGAFDITIYPVMRAWGFTGEGFRVPSDEELSRLTDAVDMTRLRYEDGILTIPENMEIDFGGIAKGYTAARVAQIMEQYGVKSANLSLGGNIQVVGAKPDQSAWRVAIRSPEPSEAYVGIVSIENKAVVTSGGYERYFEQDGMTYHHIIDPKTGKPVYNGLVSVTIISEDGTYADGMSTALFVLGRDKTISYWRSHREKFDFVLMDESGMMYVSEGIEKDFTSEREYQIIR